MEEISIRDYPAKCLASFDCGEEKLNTFLFSYAKQNENRGVSRTFALIGEGAILGFYTLSSAQIEFAQLPFELSKRLPRYPIPAIRIARFAVAKNQQGKGIGKALLKLAFKRILSVSLNMGAVFVLVDAKESSASFYEHFGFSLIDKEKRIYALPIATLLKAVIG